MKNDLFLKVLKGETVNRPPVWIMRQAGRYLPDFMKIKKKYDFFTRCQTPELATEITLMPINQIGPDAAIIFSDILVIFVDILDRLLIVVAAVARQLLITIFRDLPISSGGLIRVPPWAVICRIDVDEYGQ